MEELSRRADILKADRELRKRLIAAIEFQREEYPPSPHVEKQIYDGFVMEPDIKLMAQFHDTEWQKRIAIVESFQDPRLKAIGKQLIYLERPELLDDAARREHDLAAARRLLGQCQDVSWMTLPQALEQIEGLQNDVSGADLQMLQEHERYLRKLHQQALRNIA